MALTIKLQWIKIAAKGVEKLTTCLFAYLQEGFRLTMTIQPNFKFSSLVSIYSVTTFKSKS